MKKTYDTLLVITFILGFGVSILLMITGIYQASFFPTVSGITLFLMFFYFAKASTDQYIKERCVRKSKMLRSTSPNLKKDKQ